MARYAKKKNNRLPLPIALAVLVLAAVGYYFGEARQPVEPVSQSAVSVPAEGTAEVTFLDVGQGDSELILLPDGETVLIDAGTRSTAGELTQWLKDRGIQKIDHLIATHPHEDHIGGMTKVVENFDIGKIYLPKVADVQTPTTKTYENLLDAVAEKGLKLTQGKSGMTVLEEGGAKLEFLAPNSGEYSDLNSYSIVAKFSFGETSFLFTGDAETDSEQEMVEKGLALKSDVLKCGHHGSSTSTSGEFLKAVSPEYAVISCGVDNDYGHPHQEVMDRLEKAGIQILRTDRQDTIRMETDGKTLTVYSEEPSVIPEKKD